MPVEGSATGFDTTSQEESGGFGGMLFRANDWASREATLWSYELLAREVIPRFLPGQRATAHRLA